MTTADPRTVKVAARYAALVGESLHDADGIPLRYPSVLLRTRSDYGEGRAMLPRGLDDEEGLAKEFLRGLGQKVAALPVTRTYTYSPSHETGPYKDYSRSLYVAVMSQTSAEWNKLPEAHKHVIDDVRDMIRDMERFLDAKLKAEGYRFRKEEQAPAIWDSSQVSHLRPLARANVTYTFVAPTESWKEMRDEGETWVRGVRDPFPLVPLEFLESLRKPLKQALGAESEVWWDTGGQRFHRMAARVATHYLLGQTRLSSEGAAWDWKPVARHVAEWMEQSSGNAPEAVWMTQYDDRIIINFAEGGSFRHLEPRALARDRREWQKLRRSLSRFGLTPDINGGDPDFERDDGVRVRIDIGRGGRPPAQADRLARFSSEGAARSPGMHTAADTSPLDGLRKQKVLDILNRLMAPHTKGLFRDNAWAPIQAIRAAFERENIPADQLPGSGRYEAEGGRDVRKVWLYQVPFTNQNGRPDKVYIRIVASGSGPVDDPLEVYDVVAYAS